MLYRRFGHARIRRLPGIAFLAAAFASAATGAWAQADADRLLAGPNPGADPIIGATDVLVAPETLTLVHPTVVTTARLQADGTIVNLSGIEGEGGDAAQSLQDFLAGAGDRVDCRPQGDAGSVCVMPDGTDIAEVALANGAARVRPDAPDAYREQEIAAQDARRGLWANLPPPPETVRHPIVRDTATLASARKTYPLDGVIGLETPYADWLQAYIAAHGDSVTCSPQGDAGKYVCFLPDGTDIAKVALTSGAARAEPDAPDAYRAQQLDAVNNRRGVWLAATEDVTADALTPPPETEYVLAAGDDGTDGISYVGRTPMAVIGGAPVVLAFGAGLGWGYYDHQRRWHAAPGAYRAHLEHFHPDGRGLPGFGHRGEAMRHEVALRSSEVFRQGSAWYGTPVRPGMPGTVERPGQSGLYGHPPPPGHPGMVEPLRQDHPWSHAPAGPPGMSRPAMQRPGGGFSNQRAVPRASAPAQPMRATGSPPHGNAAMVRRQ
jgi:endonuclease YncB( thermonuclease family)